MGDHGRVVEGPTLRRAVRASNSKFDVRRPAVAGGGLEAGGLKGFLRGELVGTLAVAPDSRDIMPPAVREGGRALAGAGRMQPPVVPLGKGGGRRA